MTEPQGQVASELDTDEKWDSLRNSGLEFKARQLEYLGWNLSPHCKKKMWRKYRSVRHGLPWLNTFTQHTNS